MKLSAHNHDPRRLNRDEQNAYFWTLTKNELVKFADGRQIVVRERSKRNPEEFIKTLPLKSLIIERILDELERRGEGIYPTLPEGISKDILNIILQQGDAGSIMNLIRSNKRFYSLERDNKELFWKGVFYQLFPEYVEVFQDIQEGTEERNENFKIFEEDEDIFPNVMGEYKKLVLWLSWATRTILKDLEKGKKISLIRDNKGFTRIDVIRYGNWYLTTRAFCFFCGFHKGRLLALEGPAEMKSDSLQEFVQNESKKALWWMMEHDATKIGNTSNDEIMYFISKAQETKPFKNYLVLPEPPKSKTTGTITLGNCISCKTKEAEWMDENDKTKVYCSHECARK